MIYNESGNIVIFFESGNFEFSNKELGSKKMEDLENKIKQEVDELQIITSEIKDPNLNINDKCVKLKKRSKCLGILANVLGLTFPAGLLIGVINLIRNKEILALISGLGGSIIGFTGIFYGLSQDSKNKKELIKAYEDNINLSLDILEKLDKMSLNSDDKKKVKEALEKVKNTVNEINDLKEAFKNEQKQADQISSKYNLENRLYNAGGDVSCIGVVLSSNSDDEFTYLNTVIYGDGIFVNCDLGLTKSNLDPRPPKIKTLDYKRLSDSWSNKDINWGRGYKNYYLIIKCEKTDYKFKKGQIFINYC